MTTVRITPNTPGRPTSTARLFHASHPGPMDEYDVVCTIEWESPTVAWIKAAKGIGSRKLWFALVRELRNMGVITLRADRHSARVLPRATRLDDGTMVIQIKDYARWLK